MFPLEGHQRPRIYGTYIKDFLKLSTCMVFELQFNLKELHFNLKETALSSDFLVIVALTFVYFLYEWALFRTDTHEMKIFARV